MTKLTRRVAPGLNVVDSNTLVDALTGVAYTNTGVTVLARLNTAVTVSNTTTETTVFTYADDGSHLETNRLLRLTVMGTITDSALDTATTVALRFKYGGTTMATKTVTTDDGANTIGSSQGFRLVFDLLAVDSSSSQISYLSGTVPKLTVVTEAIALRGTATEDSSAAQDLILTFDWNNAAAAASITLDAAVLEWL